MTHRTPRPLPLIALGVSAGLLAGLFGIGGGTLIVPGLVLLMGMSQRLAAGTSVAAILPTAVVGAISYGVGGNVDWIAAAALAAGIIAGAQLGSYLLDKLNIVALQWSFIAFIALVAVSLWLVVPERSAQIDINVFSVIWLLVTGMLVGTVGGIVGVGGGVVVVPILMFFFGSSDLIAKGTSLVMMIPGSISGTLGNLRRSNVDLRAAAYVGISASIVVPFSTLLSTSMSPLLSNILFSAYLTALFVHLIIKQLRSRKR